MRHNKKRNSALLYELLIKHISKCLVEGKKDEANKTMVLSRKYFSEGSPLRNELNLFDSVLKSKVKSEKSAHRILGLACSSAALMNARLLDEQKSKIIKEINYTFQDRSFYDHKVPCYTAYASLQTLFNDSRNRNKKLREMDKVKLEDSIVQHIIVESNDISKNYSNLSVNPNYNTTIYNFLIQRFHKKYEGKLNEGQKKLLTQYSVYLISNKKEQLQEFIKNQIEDIKSSLRNIKDESLKKDEDLMKKVDESYKKFVTENFEELNEQNILKILQYMKLVEEIKS